jgi:hypothetical protein
MQSLNYYFVILLFSITVPLDDTEYWSNKKYLYTGVGHRETFDQSLQTIYHDLYNKASQVTL